MPELILIPSLISEAIADAIFDFISFTNHLNLTERERSPFFQIVSDILMIFEVS